MKASISKIKQQIQLLLEGMTGVDQKNIRISIIENINKEISIKITVDLTHPAKK